MKYGKLLKLYKNVNEGYKATIIYVNKDGDEKKAHVEDNDNIRRAVSARVAELKNKGHIVGDFRVDYDMDSK